MRQNILTTLLKKFKKFFGSCYSLIDNVTYHGDLHFEGFPSGDTLFFQSLSVFDRLPIIQKIHIFSKGNCGNIAITSEI